MTYETLKKTGTFLGEKDWYVRDGLYNGAYAGTSYYYLHGRHLYCRIEPNNGLDYQGETVTYLAISNVGDFVKKYNFLGFCERENDYDLYKTICEIYGVTPDPEVDDDEQY